MLERKVDIITHPTNINKVIKDFYENLWQWILKIWWGKFLEKYNSPKPTQKRNKKFK